MIVPSTVVGTKNCETYPRAHINTHISLTITLLMDDIMMGAR